MENRLPGLYYIETDSPVNVRSTTGVTKPLPNSGWRRAVCGDLRRAGEFRLSLPERISLAILSPTSREKLLSLLRNAAPTAEK